MADIFAEHVAHREKSCPGKCLGAELVQLRSLSKKTFNLEANDSIFSENVTDKHFPNQGTLFK